MAHNEVTRRQLLQSLLVTSVAAGLPWQTAQAAAEQDLTQVTLRVGDQTSAVQGLFRAAGLLEKIPYKVEWSSYPAAVNLHEALKANATDFGGANDSPTVSAIAGGSKVKVVSGWNNGGLGTALITQKDSGIHSLADLRGKTISPTTRGSVAHHLVVGLLKQAGIAHDEVQFAFLSPTDASAAFGAKSIDAWAIWGIFKARAIGALGARVVDDGTRINSGLFINSATPQALAHPGKLAAIAHFSALQDQSYEWARQNRDAYLDWYAAFSKQDKAVVADLYDEQVLYRRIPLDDAFVARLKQTHDVWLENGVLKGAIDFNEHVYRNLPLA